jgi:hypothetical protein
MAVTETRRCVWILIARDIVERQQTAANAWCVLKHIALVLSVLFKGAVTTNSCLQNVCDASIRETSFVGRD